MALPVLKQTLFEFNLPSTGQLIRFHPFTVAEEKILLMAQAADDTQSKIQAIKQIITNCTVEPANLDVEKLASFDIEYFFVQLRAKSVSNIVEAEIKLGEQSQKVNIDLNMIKVHNKAEKKLLISEEEGIGVTLNFPTFETILTAQKQADNPDAAFDMFRDLIETVYTPDEVFDVKQHPKKELDDFLDSLDLHQLEKVQEWINSLPYVYIDVPYKDDEGQQKTIQLRGLESFFGS